MTFIVLLAALIIDRLYGAHKVYRHFNWFTQWQGWLQQRFFKQKDNDWLPSLVSLVVPLWAFNTVITYVVGINVIAGFVVSVAILLITIGPLDFENSVDDYIRAKSAKDDEQARYYASFLIYDENQALNETEEVQVTRSLLYCSVEHFFATLFWFVIVGPVAALLYRIVLQNYLNNRNNKWAKLILAYAIFIPAHLVSFSFALVGSFEETIKKLQNMNEYSSDLLSKCHKLTVASGCAALQLNMMSPEYLDENYKSQITLVENARAIILRSLVVWLSVVLIVELSRITIT